ncbi:MAG: SDR family oxidoreductase [Cytophagales bacterium]|nr:SDR family oxidoreductase [Cytophagales bacterium]
MKPWVLVTGGAQRLGREICLAFTKAGWGAICHYRHSHEQAIALEAEIRAFGGSVILMHAELNNAKDAKQLMALSIQSLQCQKEESEDAILKCLINNASSFMPDSATDADGEALRTQMETNFVVPVVLARALHAHHQQMGTQASVVHILDQKVLNLNADYSNYTLSKLALTQAVRQQAQALAPAIRVNGIAPGLIYPSGPQTQENFKIASTVNALGRRIDPASIAATAVFLAHNPCITGQLIAVDNGQHLVPLERDVMFVAEEFLKRKSN